MVWLVRLPDWRSRAAACELRDKLAQDLKRVLPGAAKQHDAFLHDAMTAIQNHFTGSEPATAAKAGRALRLDRLARAAHEFSNAVGALDGDTQDVVELALWAGGGKKEFMPFSLCTDAARSARTIAEAVDRLISRRRDQTKKGGRPSGSFLPTVGLVVDLAYAYAECFGERPSFWRGEFSVVLHIVLVAAGLPKIGDTQGSDILKRLPMSAPQRRRA